MSLISCEITWSMVCIRPLCWMTVRTWRQTMSGAILLVSVNDNNNNTVSVGGAGLLVVNILAWIGLAHTIGKVLMSEGFGSGKMPERGGGWGVTVATMLRRGMVQVRHPRQLSPTLMENPRQWHPRHPTWIAARRPYKMAPMIKWQPTTTTPSNNSSHSNGPLPPSHPRHDNGAGHKCHHQYNGTFLASHMTTFDWNNKPTKRSRGSGTQWGKYVCVSCQQRSWALWLGHRGWCKALPKWFKIFFYNNGGFCLEISQL